MFFLIYYFVSTGHLLILYFLLKGTTPYMAYIELKLKSKAPTFNASNSTVIGTWLLQRPKHFPSANQKDSHSR